MTHKLTICLDFINDTKKWIVLIDKFYGVFETKEQANEVYSLIGNIEESPFGSSFLFPPDYIYETFTGYKSKNKISDFKPIDIKRYIIKNIEKPFNPPFVSKVERYKQRKEIKNFFDWE